MTPRAWLCLLALLGIGARADAVVVQSHCNDGDPCTIDSRDRSGRCRNVDLARCAYPHAATVLPLPSGSACTAISSCPIPDGDGDGLNDAWEIQGGIDLDCDGRIEPADDLKLPGADPARPDIYLEYAYMVLPDQGTFCTGSADCGSGQTCRRGVCRGHSHRPRRESVQAVVDAFARQGITLHVDRGEALPHSTVVTFGRVDPACAGDDAVDFHDLKARRFDGRRALAHHYVVFGHYNTCGSIESCGLCPPEGGQGIVFGTGGKAELPGDDFIVSTGALLEAGFKPGIEHEAGLLMHELGHNFGLRHGGESDLPEFKPNYLSAMNNSFTYVGIPVADGPGSTTPIACESAADCPPGAVCGSLNRICTRIDYSARALPDLDETDLDEGRGIGADSDDLTTYNCPDTTPVAGNAAAPIDWNCNGDAGEAGVAADVNADGTLGTLTGWDDWPRLLLTFQCTAAGSIAGPPPPSVVPPAEPSLRQMLRRRGPDLD